MMGTSPTDHNPSAEPDAQVRSACAGDCERRLVRLEEIVRRLVDLGTTLSASLDSIRSSLAALEAEHAAGTEKGAPDGNC